MEQELRSNLLRCGEAFAAAAGLELSTLGRQAAGDWRFFERLRRSDKTFTARKYDEVIAWLSARWPADLAWPDGVDRPESAEVAS